MSRDSLRPARQVALQILEQVDEKSDDIASVLHGSLNRTYDRGLAADLVLGTFRNRNCIDLVIHKVSDVAVERISPELINILRMGVYELVYCPDREIYAVVSETMKLTSRMAAKQKGFVNAILRKMSRLIVDRSASFASTRHTKTIPVSPASGCRFDMDILSDPANEPAAYLAAAFSLPQWLVDGWIESYGFKDAMQACFGSNRRPSVYVRPNTLKCSGIELYERFQKDSVECEIVIDEGWVLQTRGGRAVENLPGFDEGCFSVQDLTASEAVRAIGLQPGWNVLDICAAPGGKTIQMAQLMGDKGKIVATDFDAARLQRVRENITRMGIKSVEIVPYADIEYEAEKVNGFDTVLLDVPCSNTGVLARRCEVRYRLTKRAISSLVKVQREILARAAGLVKAGGRICYSTCSIQEDENEAQVEWFLKEREGFEVLSQKMLLPAAGKIDRDGGFVAVLRRI